MLVNDGNNGQCPPTADSMTTGCTAGQVVVPAPKVAHRSPEQYKRTPRQVQAARLEERMSKKELARKSVNESDA